MPNPTRRRPPGPVCRRSLSASLPVGLCAGLLASLAAGLLCSAAVAQDSHWPSFRGHHASGVAEGFATPLRWDAMQGEGIRWKTPIPGLAHSSPVIWGERVFVTTAVPEALDPELKVGLYGAITPAQDLVPHRFEVYCLDKRSGEVLWQKTAHEGVPKTQRHLKSSHANSTPATDGERLITLLGSEGLYAWDLDGQLLWHKDLGPLDIGPRSVPAVQWGFGSSPIIHQDRVIVLADVRGKAFLLALDADTGTEVWRTPRRDVPTWGSPTVYRNGPFTQIAVNGFQHIGGYDFATGAELWQLRGGGDAPVPTPFVAGDLLFFTSSHGGPSPVFAVSTAAEGVLDLAEGATSGPHIAWSVEKGGAYMPTPVVYGDLLYVCRNNGVLSCFDARTGELQYRERMAKGTGFTASSVAADGKVYFTSEEGEVHVVRAGPEFELLATNPLGEVTLATPAISEGVLFFRTRGHLVAVAGSAAP